MFTYNLFPQHRRQHPTPDQRCTSVPRCCPNRDFLINPSLLADRDLNLREGIVTGQMWGASMRGMDLSGFNQDQTGPVR